MTSLLININDVSILNEAPKETIVIANLNRDKKIIFKKKFNLFSTYDIFHDPLSQTKKINKQLIYPSREEIKYINSNFMNFCFQLNRWTKTKKSNYKLDQKMLFEYLVFWLTLIEHNSISKCFIDEDPHRAFDYIGYLILKFKRIPCYILSNMNFGGYRTYIKKSIESNLLSSLEIKEIDPKLVFNIENSEVDLQHIPEFKKRKNIINKILKILDLNNLRSLFIRIKQLFFWNVYTRPKPLLRINYPLTKLNFYFCAMIMKLIYKIFFEIFSVNNIEIKNNDIIFYSHYFPERTSIPLSDPFGYNILDCISFLKETGNRVIYKEHPVSLALMNTHRNICHHNFDYMSKLINARVPLVKDVRKNRHIVATLNGTVGLELAMQGFKVICFGNPWYGFLPNVYIYKDIISMKDFIENGIVFNEEEILNCLINNCNNFSTPFCINNRYCEPNLKSEELKKIFCKFIF